MGLFSASFGGQILYNQYVRNMPNKSNKGLAEPDQRFIEDVARLLVPWGVPQTAARLYGYLLLNAEPVSLDRMTTDLEISKSSASVAARLLEQYTLARRLGERGSKRALYEVSDNYEGMLTQQNRLLDALAGLLRAGADSTASATTRDRLDEMAEFYLVTRQAMESVLCSWRERRRK
jgi:DNA-binding transcriptional regulator GbsR (MarR family)